MAPARRPSAGSASSSAPRRRSRPRPAAAATIEIAANCAEPAKTIADMTIASTAEKPASRASTPNDNATHAAGEREGTPARRPARKELRADSVRASGPRPAGTPTGSAPPRRRRPDARRARSARPRARLAVSFEQPLGQHDRAEVLLERALIASIDGKTKSTLRRSSASRTCPPRIVRRCASSPHSVGRCAIAGCGGR